jgi:hypothetical protein
MVQLNPVVDPDYTPSALLRLPRDARGYPVPWFVKWYGSRPDFRVVGEGKFSRAVAGQRCWICGERLGRYLCFVVGPMCVINRVTSEPPSHRECAEYAARVCPFLAIPRMHRQNHDLPDDIVPPAGDHNPRNPGVVAIYIAKKFDVVSAGEGHPGRLIQMGEPTEVTWWREGRLAVHAEVNTAMLRGLTALYEQCRSPKDQQDLGDAYARAVRLMPAEVAP